MGFLCLGLSLLDEASREEGHVSGQDYAPACCPHLPAGLELAPSLGHRVMAAPGLGTHPETGQNTPSVHSRPPPAIASSFLASQEWIDQAQSPPAFPLGPPCGPA